jgi:hypothetical protein
MMTVFASAIGPVLLAKTFERTGSYSSVFFVLSAAVSLTGVLAWRVPLPARAPVGMHLIKPVRRYR